MKKISKAFTLVEVVITMALVIISTIFAISVSVYCTAQANRMHQQFRASNFATDILNCYITARNEPGIAGQSEAFLRYLRFYTDFAAIGVQSDEYQNYDYSFALDELIVNASIYYTTGVFSVRVSRGESDSPFYSFAYNTELNIVLEGG